MKVFYYGLLILMVLALADPLLAEGILDQIGWRDSSRRDPTAVLLLVAGITAVFILVYRAYLDTRQKIEKQKKDAAEQNASQKEFLRRQRAAGLNETETAVLQDMLKNSGVVKPHTVFESAAVFEKCVDLEIRHLVRRRVPAAKQQDIGAAMMRLRKRLGYADLPAADCLPSTRNMALGQTGSIYGRSSRVPDRLVLLISRVEVIEIGWLCFTLGYDVQQTESCRFLPGEKLRFSFSRTGDARYRVTLTVAANSVPGRIELYHSSELKRQQSRSEFRLDAEVPVQFKVVKRSVMSDTDEAAVGRMFTARTCNVSGGGLSMVSDQHLGAGDFLEVGFEVLGEAFTLTHAEVVCALKPQEPEAAYRYLVKFNEIEKSVQEQLVKQIFEMARKKGLGELPAEQDVDETDELDDGIYIVN